MNADSLRRSISSASSSLSFESVSRICLSQWSQEPRVEAQLLQATQVGDFSEYSRDDGEGVSSSYRLTRMRERDKELSDSEPMHELRLQMKRVTNEGADCLLRLCKSHLLVRRFAVTRQQRLWEPESGTTATRHSGREEAEREKICWRKSNALASERQRCASVKSG